MFSKTSGQLLREHTRNPRHLDLHPHTGHKEMFMPQDCCARTPQAHLDLAPCAKRHVPAKRPLRSHAASTLGSHTMRKQTCSGDNTAAFSRREHTWISLRAQARRHVPSKRLLRSHAASTLGSLSVRKETCSIEKTAAFSRRERTRPLLYREPVTRNPSHRAFALQIVNPRSVYAVGELY